MTAPKKKPNTTFKNLFYFSGVGIQMGLTIYLGAYAGKWLDLQYPSNKNWFTITLTLVAVAISLYTLLKQIQRFNKNNP